MTYQEILNKKAANILITGDSLSFNRYGYDEETRGANDAFCYGVGIKSWSFKLRDRIYLSDPQFIFGDSLSFNCDTVLGIDNDSDVPNTAMFDGKIKTLLPENDVEFTVSIKSDEIILYLQRRIDFPCIFDIRVDNVLVKKDVDTTGYSDDFAGYGLMLLRLPCNNELELHKIEFVNIRGITSRITVVGAGAVYKNIILNGRGSQCTSFFIDNFEERIAKHNPDLIIISLTANDRILISAEAMESNLTDLFSKIFERFAHCKILFLLPTSSHNPSNLNIDNDSYTSKSTAEKYYLTAEAVCEKLLKAGNDIDTFRISSLFDDNDVSFWRYDNIHLTPHGNDILLKAICEKLFINH